MKSLLAELNMRYFNSANGLHIGNVIQIGSARAVKHPESTDVVLHDLHHLIDLKNYPNIQNIAYLMLG